MDKDKQYIYPIAVYKNNNNVSSICLLLLGHKAMLEQSRFYIVTTTTLDELLISPWSPLLLDCTLCLLLGTVLSLFHAILKNIQYYFWCFLFKNYIRPTEWDFMKSEINTSVMFYYLSVTYFAHLILWNHVCDM